MVDVTAVIDVEDVDDAGGFVNAVDDPVGAAPGAIRVARQVIAVAAADCRRTPRELPIAVALDCLDAAIKALE